MTKLLALFRLSFSFCLTVATTNVTIDTVASRIRLQINLLNSMTAVSRTIA